MLPNGLHKKRKATINRRLQQQEVVVVLATGLRESEKSNHQSEKSNHPEVAVMRAARSSCHAA